MMLSKEILRSRLVVPDFATGPSAAELGVSSPTASSEALKIVLSYLPQKSSFRRSQRKVELERQRGF